MFCSVPLFLLDFILLWVVIWREGGREEEKGWRCFYGFLEGSRENN
jgi:hypothetical protein